MEYNALWDDKIVAFIANVAAKYPRLMRVLSRPFFLVVPRIAINLKSRIINRNLMQINLQNDSRLVEGEKVSKSLWIRKHFKLKQRSLLNFVGLMPPSESSIAKYNRAVFGSSLVTFIPTNLSFEETILSNQSTQIDFLPLDSIDVLPRNKKQFFLISLGNSPDHIKTILALEKIKTTIHRYSWSLQLHDVDLMWLLQLSFGIDYRDSIVDYVYKTSLKIESENAAEKIDDNLWPPLGIGLLCHVYGVPQKIFVHNLYARSLVLKDLEASGFHTEVIVLQLPFVDVESDLSPKTISADPSAKSRPIRIGTLGAADKHKNFIETYNVLKSLRSRGIDVNWVVVGRNCTTFLESLKISDPWIEILDKVDDSEFMQSIIDSDLIFQLRLQARGESSGVCLQAQYFRKPLLTSPEIVNWHDPESTFFLTSADFVGVTPTEGLISRLSRFIELYEPSKTPLVCLPKPEQTLKTILRNL